VQADEAGAAEPAAAEGAAADAGIVDQQDAASEAAEASEEEGE